MSKIDIHVFGMHSRDDMIKDIVDKLDLSYDEVHYDDRPDGGMMIYTAKKAWLAPIPDDVTHRVVLADDVEVCDGFWEICERIAETHPDSIVSLFPFEFMEPTNSVENLDTPYVYCSILSGCAIIMPTKYIERCFSFIKETFNDVCADDEGIQAWAEQADIPIITTIPATVQHIGDISIANKTSPIRRTCYYVSNPVANWDNTEIVRAFKKEWFFSNNGVKITRKNRVTKLS